MAHKLQDLVMQRCPQVKGTDRLVLLALAYRANDSGACWPSAATIAYDANVSLRAVRYALKYLKEEGIIDFSPSVGRGNSCIYQLDIVAIGGMYKPERPEAEYQRRPVEIVQDLHPLPEETVQNMHDLSEEMVQNVPQMVQNTSVNGANNVINGARFAHRTIQEVNIEPNKNIPRTRDETRALKRLEDETFEQCFKELRSVWPKHRWGNKDTCQVMAREMPPDQWPRLVQCAKNYVASSEVVLAQKPMLMEKFLAGERWTGYEDGPVIDRPTATNGNGRFPPHVDERTMEHPPSGCSWDRYPDGRWRPMRRDFETGLFPYSVKTLEEAKAIDKEKAAQYLSNLRKVGVGGG